MNSNIKTAVFWVVIVMVVVLLWTVVKQTKSRPDDQPSFTALMNYVEQDRVKSIVITGGDAHGTYNNDQGDFHAQGPQNYQPLIDLLLQEKGDVKFDRETSTGLV